MKIFLACLLAGIAYAILTQVIAVPPQFVLGGVIFAAIVGYISG